MRKIIVIILGLIFISCQGSKDVGLITDEVRWQLYKFNLLEGDRICQIIPENDSILQSGRLYEYRLVADSTVEKPSNDIYALFFENGVAPCHSYYYSIKFLHGKNDSLVLNPGERGEITLSSEDGELEFHNYLKGLPSASIASDLSALIRKRKIINE